MTIDTEVKTKLDKINHIMSLSATAKSSATRKRIWEVRQLLNTKMTSAQTRKRTQVMPNSYD